MAEKIIVTILGILALIAILVWVLHYPDYLACLKNPKMEKEQCFIDFLMLSPPVQDAMALQQACDPNNSSDLSCELVIAQRVAEQKFSK